MSQTTATQEAPAASPPPGRRARKRIPSGTITVFGLAMLNVAAVAGLTNDSEQAEYGLASVTFFVLAAIFYLLPICLIAAELASGWPEPGGVFRWVGEGLGKGLGFAAIFLLFMEITFQQPAVLTNLADIIGFFQTDIKVGMDWANHPTTWVVLVAGFAYYWLVTFLATRGVSVFQGLAKWGVVFGTLVPLAAMVILVIIWLAAGNKPEIEFTWSGLAPKWQGLGTLALIGGVFFSYAGMEMNAAHIKQLKNPRKQYPMAILIAAVLAMAIFIIGTLIIAMVIPSKDINVIYSLYATFNEIGKAAGIPWVFTVVAWMSLIAGAAGTISWLAGVPLMLVGAGRGGFLPKGIQKLNDKGMPARLMYLMAIVVSVVLVGLVLLPNVEGFYLLISQAVTVLYLSMYVLMFWAFIRLRKTQPNRPRSFRVPGGMAGAWIIGGVGLLATFFGYFVAFIPPAQVKGAIGNPIIYIGGIALLVAVSYLLAFFIYRARKPSWVDPTNTTPPLTWEIEGLKKPGVVTSNVPTEMLSAGQAGMGQPIKKLFSPEDQVTEQQLIAGGFVPAKAKGKTGAPSSSTLSAEDHRVLAAVSPSGRSSSTLKTTASTLPATASTLAHSSNTNDGLPQDPVAAADVAARAAQEAAMKAQQMADAAEALAKEAEADKALAQASADVRAAHAAAEAAEQKAQFIPSVSSDSNSGINGEEPEVNTDGKTNA